MLDNIKSLNVSRETLDHLKMYAEQITIWTKKINLISPTTINSIWERHMLDCMQLFRFLEPEKKIVDFGSGAGLPGIVMAIMGCKNIHLIESDARKCVFLTEMVRLLSITQQVKIHNKRIEGCIAFNADTIISRACAPLDLLLSYSKIHMKSGGKCFFMKGKQLQNEIMIAKEWELNYILYSSLTDTQAFIMEVTAMEKINV